MNRMVSADQKRLADLKKALEDGAASIARLEKSVSAEEKKRTVEILTIIIITVLC